MNFADYTNFPRVGSAIRELPLAEIKAIVFK